MSIRPTASCPDPLLVADSHLHETQDSLTQYLADVLDHLTSDEQAKFMGGNRSRLVGV